jgi:CubicO group peptidase (beta-lactamase class C family)
VGLLVLATVITVVVSACSAPTPPAGRSTAPTTTAAPTPASIATAAHAFLTGLVNEQQFRGTVLLVLNGHVLVRSAYDKADVASTVPNTVTTHFQIASLTKAFTALAILQLQQHGQLAISDPVCRYLTPCPTTWGSITLAQVLTHSSGIPNYTDQSTFDGGRTTPYTGADIVALVAGLPLNFPPGTSFRYSNTGYTLLGMIIARVSGQSYPDYIRSHILTPLGMTNTTVDLTHPTLPADATGYHDWTTPAPYENVLSATADGDIDSTVDDLYQWDQALLSGRSLVATPAMLTEMFHPWVPTINGGSTNVTTYGYGWFIGPHGNQYEHTGGIPGFVSQNVLWPHQHAILIVLSNLDTIDLGNMAQHLATIAGLPFTP